ncbi:MAG: energy-coupling factor transporter ATPase [Lachnospiraceae bacterium]
MWIRLENISYTYGKGTSYEKKALNHINMEIQEGEFIGIIGHTGSGKSTLIQHLNGLLKATEGTIFFKEENIYKKNYKKRNLRNQVGIVFQYPEQQLFESTVLKDVAFGSRNQGFSQEESNEKAKSALKLVGLSENLYEESPMELSGGQKRRAAIAGVLAMEPSLLILDEPTAGLDPKGRREILEPIRQLNKEKNMAVILVSHNMEDIAEYANRLIVMDKGSVKYDDTPNTIFMHTKELKEIGLSAPEPVLYLEELINRGLPIQKGAITLEEAAEEIFNQYKKAGGRF